MARARPWTPPVWLFGNDFWDDSYTCKYVRQNRRDSPRPPPLWMALNMFRGLCWCGKPRDMWGPRRRTHCCRGHATLWEYAIHARWSIYRTYLVRAVARCERCGADYSATKRIDDYGITRYNRHEDKMDVDHIEPLALGGSMWDSDNHMVLCKACHRAKTADDNRRIAGRRLAEKSKKRRQKPHDGLTLADFAEEWNF